MDADTLWLNLFVAVLIFALIILPQFCFRVPHSKRE